MFNPMQLFNAMKNSANPMGIIQQFAAGNAQMQDLLSQLQNKTPQELEQFARNVAKSRNIDLKQYMSQFGVNIN